MKLLRLELTNFRGFERLEMDLHERLTVLVGGNGSGKSSVFEATRLLLVGAFNRFVGPGFVPGGEGAQVADIREESHLARLSLTGRAENKDWAYSEVRTRPPLSSPPVSFRFEVDHGFSDYVRSEWLAVGYSTRRALLDEGIGESVKSRELLDSWSAFGDALTTRGSLDSFVAWFRAREDLENEVRLRQNAGFRDPQLEAVRKALASAIGGDGHLFAQRQPREALMLHKDGKKLTLNQLSDGERCLIATVGDLARRLAMVAREGQDPLEVEAFVMIDEIELHLHPKWQREVVAALLRAFPRCQFLLSTHSLQVLGSVPKESLFVLDAFRLYPATSPTEGRRATAVLADLMGLP
jgi:predicted ATP-binding protein involved in virulence